MPIYLDHAASTSLLPEVHELLAARLHDECANSESKHQWGRSAMQCIEQARALCLSVLQANDSDEFIFTSSATESNNTVIASCLNRSDATVVVSSADHASVTRPAAHYCQNTQVHELPLMASLDVDINALFEQWQQVPSLVVLTHVNSLSGHVLDVVALATTIKAHWPTTHVHVDAAQSFTKMPLDLSTSVIDTVSVSSHKISGPKGVSGLYVRHGVSIAPLLLGGGHEHGLRSSTPPTSLIEGFALAAQLNTRSLSSHHSCVCQLNHTVRSYLDEHQPSVTMPFAFLPNQSPYILTLLLPGIPSDVMMRHLEQAGIMVSARTACSAKKQAAMSPELLALGVPASLHGHALRVSFSSRTTQEEVSRFCQQFSDTLSMLSGLQMLS